MTGTTPGMSERDDVKQQAREQAAELDEAIDRGDDRAMDDAAQRLHHLDDNAGVGDTPAP